MVNYMNRLVEKTFENRGITDAVKYMSDINNAEHDLLKDIDLLANHLNDVYNNQQHIVVLPDFDTDGIMSGVIGLAGLSTMGFRVSLFIPDVTEGYGFTPRTIDKLLLSYPTCNTILTCDVGSTCIDGISYAISRGINVVVTDHHVLSEANYKDNKASIIVNPMRFDETYSHPNICGAYVLYQCLQYYADTYRSFSEQERVSRLRVFAGIGTVSDSMPVLYENRQLVRDAVDISRLLFMGGPDLARYMSQCDSFYSRAFYGLATIFSVFENFGKLKTVSDVTASFFGFYLAPMLNSVKRLGDSMTHAFDVFFGTSPEQDIQYLYNLNNERKRLVASELQSIHDSDQPFAPYVYITDAYSGILGLLATQLMAETGLPTVVVSSTPDHGFSGSGRSPAWYPFMTSVSPLFHAAGHEHAFGISLSDYNNLSELFSYLSNDVPSYVPSDCISQKPDFVIATDGSGDTDIDLFSFSEYISELSRYEPFGVDFAEPYISFRFNASDGVWHTIGDLKQHIKVVFRYGFELLCFNQGQLFDKCKQGGSITAVGHLVRNRFKDKYTIEFIGQITDIAGDKV